MNLIEKLQNAHDSMKSHETVTVELDWYEVAQLIALEKANEVYLKTLEEYLIGNLREVEKKENENRVVLYVDKTINVREGAYASDKRIFESDHKISINLADLETKRYDKNNDCNIYRVKSTNSIAIIDG